MQEYNIEDNTLSSVSIICFTRKESDGNGLITVKKDSTKLEATINEQDSVDQKKQVLDAVQDWLNSIKDSLSS